jgi:hypothetical protein
VPSSSSLCFTHHCSKKEMSSCLFRVSRRQHRTKKNSADVSFFLVSIFICAHLLIPFHQLTNIQPLLEAIVQHDLLPCLHANKARLS